jgi:hypothetical protein
MLDPDKYGTAPETEPDPEPELEFIPVPLWKKVASGSGSTTLISRKVNIMPQKNK